MRGSKSRVRIFRGKRSGKVLSGEERRGKVGKKGKGNKAESQDLSTSILRIRIFRGLVKREERKSLGTG